MKYYKHSNAQVYAFEDDGSQDGFIPAGAVPMSVSEVAAHLAPKPPTPEELNAPILAALAAADLKIIRAIAEGDTGRITAYRASQASLRAGLR